MDTREEIINAALVLFSEHGFESVSVRDVTKLAKVNLASVSYHFGNKEGLIQEATSRILDPMNLKRVQLLKELIADRGGIEGITLEEIIRCFLKPVLMPEIVGGNTSLLAKLGAKFANTTEANASGMSIPDKTLTIYRELLINFVKTIYTKLPHMKPEDIRERLVFTSGAALQYFMLAPMAAAMTGEQDNTPREVLLEHIIDFTLNGFNPQK